MKKTVILIVFALSPVLALAHGGVDDEKLIIRMTDNGFEPKELTAVEGDEVLFINNDDVDRWPASNLHPTHGLYPEFDPLKGIKPGDSWTMKFEKAGNWRMHDHLIPHMTGVIVVLEDPDKDSASETASAPENQGFWQKIKSFFRKLFKTEPKSASALEKEALLEFQALDGKAKYAWLEARADKEGPEAAWRYVLEAYSGPKGVTGNAHDMAHLVGQFIFERYGLDGLSICTSAFAFGCYHGLIEVAFNGKDIVQYEKSVQEADGGCLKLGGTENSAYWSCVHGVGHGLITYREHDSEKALLDCDLLTERGRGYCYDGVFMELSISAPSSFYRASDPLYPCNTLLEKYQSGCARAQTRVMGAKFGLNVRTIAEACAKSTETIRYHCIDSLGYETAQKTPSEPEKIIFLCEEITGVGNQAQCKAAAAGELVFQNASGWQENAPKICRSLEGAHLSQCEERIASVKKSYGRQ